MKGHVDLSYQTLQRDLFASGLAAQIGMNAFGIWLAIKSHADVETGQAWPGMRRLGKLTGLSLGTVSACVRTLVGAKLLRVLKVAKGSKSRRGSTYIARERMDVKLGERVLCTVVLDYIPSKLQHQLKLLGQAVQNGKGGKEVFAECEIIPGQGFVWNKTSGTLQATVPVSDIPPPDGNEQRLTTPLAERLRLIHLATTRARSQAR